MRTEYGSWTTRTSIHAVKDNGEWLCSRKRGRTATECSDNLNDVTCKHCLKKLKDLKEIDYTKCGIRCNKCGMIEIIRSNEQNPIDCLVCGSNNWQEVTLKVEE